MVRKISLIVVTSLFVFGMNKLSFAMMCDKHSEHQQMTQVHSEHEQRTIETAKEAVLEEPMNVGNKICPVSGEKIDEKMKATYEYEGKVYNFCCASCVEEFKKDPDKYIKKVDEELKSESEAESKEHMMMPESEMSGGM